MSNERVTITDTSEWAGCEWFPHNAPNGVILRKFKNGSLAVRLDNSKTIHIHTSKTQAEI